MDMDPISTFSFSRQNAQPNATIRVNNEEVAVNKFVLALSSSYFERYFFDDRYPPSENIELHEPTTVEDFKRMLATLPPEQRELDDDCLQAVIILADRFAMDNVTELCQIFLIQSRKSKLYKFRIAHKYGWQEIEDEVLKTMRLDDRNFVENAKEFAMLDDDAKAAFTARNVKFVSRHFGVPLSDAIHGFGGRGRGLSGT